MSIHWKIRAVAEVEAAGFTDVEIVDADGVQGVKGMKGGEQFEYTLKGADGETMLGHLVASLAAPPTAEPTP